MTKMTNTNLYIYVHIYDSSCLFSKIYFYIYVDKTIWSIVVGSTVWPMDYHPPRHTTWMQVAETWHPLVQWRRDFKGTRKAKGNLDVYCKTCEARFDFGVKAFFRSNKKRLSFLRICKQLELCQDVLQLWYTMFYFLFWRGSNSDTRVLYSIYLRMIQWPWDLQPKFVNYLKKHSWRMWRRFTMHIKHIYLDGQLSFSDWRKSRAPPAKGKNICPRIRKVWTDLEVVESEFAPICVYIPRTILISSINRLLQLLTIKKSPCPNQPKHFKEVLNSRTVERNGNILNLVRDETWVEHLQVNSTANFRLSLRPSLALGFWKRPGTLCVETHWGWAGLCIK